MSVWLSRRERARTVPAERAAAGLPLPTQVVSNGEFTPPPRTPAQCLVGARVRARSDAAAARLGLSRRAFLRSSCGLAAAFLALNDVFGPVFAVAEAEASSLAAGKERRARFANQFVFDDQVHFVRDDFTNDGLLDLGRFAAQHWNRDMLRDMGLTLERYKFDNFVKEVFLDSDTDVALLSNAPSDDPAWKLLSNEQTIRAREVINAVAGTRRLLAHAVISPRAPGFLEEVDAQIETLRPDGWKGYTTGDPLHPEKFMWRLDDEALVYPFYERIAKAGIKTVCVHKGLLPVDYARTQPDVWRHATVDDVGQAAKDWPQLQFVIYHAALRPFLELPEVAWAAFERTGRIDWASDLAAIPKRFGVRNVYAELGTSFANSAVAHPRFCAAFVGTLVKGMGPERVLWGTDSVWYGSPQWQIEAFRRLEIPEDLRERHGLPSLGAPDGPVKNAILGGNAARLYGVDPEQSRRRAAIDGLSTLGHRLRDAGVGRSNRAYGLVARG